jgi:hypothetical protein
MFRILNKVIIWSNIKTNEKENIFLSLGLRQHKTFWKVTKTNCRVRFVCYKSKFKAQRDQNFSHISLDVVTNDGTAPGVRPNMAAGAASHPCPR